jgi:hypothetical protein
MENLTKFRGEGKAVVDPPNVGQAVGRAMMLMLAFPLGDRLADFVEGLGTLRGMELGGIDPTNDMLASEAVGDSENKMDAGSFDDRMDDGTSLLAFAAGWTVFFECVVDIVGILDARSNCSFVFGVSDGLGDGRVPDMDTGEVGALVINEVGGIVVLLGLTIAVFLEGVMVGDDNDNNNGARDCSNW